jgi:putative tryptophan/tyrosine transport system substrate-binding protein
MFGIKRREFIAMLSGAAGWPLVARAQQLGMPVIGVLNGRSPNDYVSLQAAFNEGLSAGGYVEGRNLAIEYRWAEAVTIDCQRLRMSCFIVT